MEIVGYITPDNVPYCTDHIGKTRGCRPIYDIDEDLNGTECDVLGCGWIIEPRYVRCKHDDKPIFTDGRGAEIFGEEAMKLQKETGYEYCSARCFAESQCLYKEEYVCRILAEDLEKQWHFVSGVMSNSQLYVCSIAVDYRSPFIRFEFPVDSIRQWLDSKPREDVLELYAEEDTVYIISQKEIVATGKVIHE